jgi:hypothetical protein
VQLYFTLCRWHEHEEEIVGFLLCDPGLLEIQVPQYLVHYGVADLTFVTQVDEGFALRLDRLAQ